MTVSVWKTVVRVATDFQKKSEMESASTYTLQGDVLRIDLIDIGASIQRILVPDRDGQVDDICLGFDEPGRYGDNPFYFGCIVGRVANRICKGRFRLNDREYALETNNGTCVSSVL